MVSLLYSRDIHLIEAGKQFFPDVFKLFDLTGRSVGPVAVEQINGLKNLSVHRLMVQTCLVKQRVGLDLLRSIVSPLITSALAIDAWAIFPVTSCIPIDAWFTLEAVPLLVPACSSTAVAMDETISFVSSQYP